MDDSARWLFGWLTGVQSFVIAAASASASADEPAKWMSSQTDVVFHCV